MQAHMKSLFLLGLVGSLAIPSYGTLHALIPAVPGAMTLAMFSSTFVGIDAFLCEKWGGECEYNTDCCRRLVCRQDTKTCEPRGPHARRAKMSTRTKPVTKRFDRLGRAMEMPTTSGYGR
ncbi:uncharacterized protein LOC144153221 [Haemaphysalis longicornis]